MFGTGSSGTLVPISGTDPGRGAWTHRAFLPDLLPDASPDLSAASYRVIANARAALAALDSTARQLPNPRLLRRPALRAEAQSTSALEGTYEPLAKVLIADDDPSEPGLREVLNYERMAETAFAWLEEGRGLTVPLLGELQQILVAGTPLERSTSGRIRPVQAVIGRRPDARTGELPIRAARFVPPPPGHDLQARVRDLLRWFEVDHSSEIDPVVTAAMTHYQFETLHPFHDGNGRIGRLMIVLQLYRTGTLSEPTLTVSPWFESRRGQYYDCLLGVSTSGAWDAWVQFFAQGIQESATDTRRSMLSLIDVQADLKERVRSSGIRTDNAHQLIDLAVSRLTFGVRQAAAGLNLSYNAVNKLVTSLVALDVLRPVDDRTYDRLFYAPAVTEVLLSHQPGGGDDDVDVRPPE